jgi:hypothetical protein
LDEILVGRREGERLLFVESVRNGFVPAMKTKVFEAIGRTLVEECPFANLPEKKGPDRMDREKMKKVRWVKLARLAEIAFNEITPGGHLRQVDSSVCVRWKIRANRHTHRHRKTVRSNAPSQMAAPPSGRDPPYLFHSLLQNGRRIPISLPKHEETGGISLASNPANRIINATVRQGRRRFFNCAYLACALLLLLNSPRNSSAQEGPEILSDELVENLKKGYEKLKEYKEAYDKVEELKKATEAMLKKAKDQEDPGTLPPQSSLLSSELDKRLQIVETRFRDIQLKDLIPPNPKAPAGPLDLFDAQPAHRAQALRSAATFLEVETLCLAQAEANAADLAENVKTGKAVAAAIRVTKDAVGEVIKGPVPFPILEELLKVWQDLDLVYFVRVNSLTSNINSRREDVVMEIKKRRTAAQIYAANLVDVVIPGDQERLHGDMTLLTVDAAKLRQSKAILDRDKKQLALWRDRLQESTANMATSNQRIAEVKMQGAAEVAQQNKDVAAMAELQRQINAPYTLCPNHEAFDKCTHPAEKAQYEQARAQALAKLNALQGSAGPAAVAAQPIRYQQSLSQATLRLTKESDRARALEVKIGQDERKIDWTQMQLAAEEKTQKERTAELGALRQATLELDQKVKALQQQLKETPAPQTP